MYGWVNTNISIYSQIRSVRIVAQVFAFLQPHHSHWDLDLIAVVTTLLVEGTVMEYLGSVCILICCGGGIY